MSEISWELPEALRQVVPSAEHSPAVLPNFRQSGLASVNGLEPANARCVLSSDRTGARAHRTETTNGSNVWTAVTTHGTSAPTSGNRRANDFQQNRDERWDNLESAREDRQAWRDQNREDWQQHRENLWEYRGDRAEEIWDNARDFYDDVFDDRWWGTWGWGAGWVGNYPVNPWWWWVPAAFGAAAAFVDVVTPEPVYVDYGMNVVYEDDTVYVDNQPIPAEQYTQPVIDLAVNVEQPPPPLPAASAPAPTPAQTQAATQQPEAPPVAEPAEEWLPLGVFALAQEEKGDAVMFFQISVNRAGVISGGYQSILTDEALPIAGRVDKTSQRVAWRIGDKTVTIFESSLANLTQDVSPVLVHFGEERAQTWLLVRRPEPAPAGQPQTLPEAPKTPPPLKTAAAN